MKYKVPFIKPSFPSHREIASDYKKITDANWYTNFGPYEQRFRKEIVEYLELPVDVCTVANATLGLEIAVRSLFVKTRHTREVITPSFTFASGPGVLVGQGFSPIFIDINDKWQPSIEQARTVLEDRSSQIAGILLCNTFGVGNTEIEKWEGLAKKYKKPLIIDSAAGFGSRYSKDEMIGGRGCCEVFSLHATKPFGVGEGGLIVSRDKDFIERCRQMTNFGFDDSRKAVWIGTNAKLQEINCALGLRLLKTLALRIEKRQQVLKDYKAVLAPNGFIFQPNDELSTVPFVSVISLSEERAQQTFSALQEASIEAKKYYDPVHTHPVFRDYYEDAQTLDLTNFTVGRILSLPLHDNMSKRVVDQITYVMLHN